MILNAQQWAEIHKSKALMLRNLLNLTKSLIQLYPSLIATQNSSFPLVRTSSRCGSRVHIFCLKSLLNFLNFLRYDVLINLYQHRSQWETFIGRQRSNHGLAQKELDQRSEDSGNRASLPFTSLVTLEKSLEAVYPWVKVGWFASKVSSDNYDSPNIRWLKCGNYTSREPKVEDIWTCALWTHSNCNTGLITSSFYNSSWTYPQNRREVSISISSGSLVVDNRKKKWLK